MNEDFKMGLSVTGFIIGILFVVIFGMSSIFYVFKVHINETNIVSVRVGGGEVFRGKSAFVDVDSGGYTTTVTIYKQLFPVSRVQAIYSLKDITVNPVECVRTDTEVIAVK